MAAATGYDFLKFLRSDPVAMNGQGWVLLLMPLHWLLLSVAAWRALYQLLFNPFHWEKTAHGLPRTSRLASAPVSR